jgi:rhodanese-related sulfurtransferase
MAASDDALALVRRGAQLGQAAATTGLDGLLGGLGGILFAAKKPRSAPVPNQGLIPDQAVSLYRPALEALQLDEAGKAAVEAWVTKRLGAYGYHWQAHNYGALRCLLVHAHGSDGRCLACYGADKMGETVYVQCFGSDAEALARLLVVARAATLARPVAPLCPTCGKHDAQAKASTVLDAGPIGPPGLVPIVPGPGYVTPAEALRRGATQHPGGGWNLTTVTDRDSPSTPLEQARTAKELVRGRLLANGRPKWFRGIGIGAGEGGARVVVVLLDDQLEGSARAGARAAIARAARMTAMPVRAEERPEIFAQVEGVDDLGGPILSAVGALFVALLVAGGAASIEAARLVQEFALKGVVAVPPGKDPPAGWKLEPEAACCAQKAFVELFGSMLGERLYAGAVGKGWRYARKSATASAPVSGSGEEDVGSLGDAGEDARQKALRDLDAIGPPTPTRPKEALSSNPVVAHFQQQNPSTPAAQLEAWIKDLGTRGFAIVLPGATPPAGYVRLSSSDVTRWANWIYSAGGARLYISAEGAKSRRIVGDNAGGMLDDLTDNASTAWDICSVCRKVGATIGAAEQDQLAGVEEIATLGGDLDTAGDVATLGAAARDPADAVVRLADVPGYGARQRSAELGFGFWRGGKGQDHLPDPADYVDPSCDRGERERVAAYLDGGQEVARLKGGSWCRLCQDPSSMANGNRDMTDGTYRYPDGLAHYVREHGVRVPADMEARALASGGPSDELGDAAIAKRKAGPVNAAPVDVAGYRSLREQHDVPEPVDGQPIDDGLGAASPGARFPYDPAAHFILDVRTPGEFAAGRLEGAVNVPVDDLGGRVDDVRALANGRRVAVFCVAGQRAARAVFLLRAKGIDACSGHKDPTCGCAPEAIDGADDLGGVDGTLGNDDVGARRRGGAARRRAGGAGRSAAAPPGSSPSAGSGLPPSASWNEATFQACLSKTKAAWSQMSMAQRGVAQDACAKQASGGNFPTYQAYQAAQSAWIKTYQAGYQKAHGVSGEEPARARALDDKAQELVAGWQAIEERLNDPRLDGAVQIALRAYYDRWRAWWTQWLKGDLQGTDDVGAVVDDLNAAAASLGMWTSAEQTTRIAALHARAKTHNDAVKDGQAKTGDEPELVEYVARWQAFVRELDQLGKDATAVFSWITDTDIDSAEKRFNLFVGEWNDTLPKRIELRHKKAQNALIDAAVRAAQEKAKEGTAEGPKPGEKPTEVKVPSVKPDLPESAATQAPTGPPPKKPEGPGAGTWLALGGAAATAALVAAKVLLKV